MCSLSSPAAGLDLRLGCPQPGLLQALTQGFLELLPQLPAMETLAQNGRHRALPPGSQETPHCRLAFLFQLSLKTLSRGLRKAMLVHRNAVHCYHAIFHAGDGWLRESQKGLPAISNIA